LKGKRFNYVVEHTKIECYTKQIEENIKFKNLFESLRTRLSGHLPSPGHYHLIIPAEVVFIKLNEKKVRIAIENWVRAKAIELELEHEIFESPNDVPFEITLRREKSAIPQIEGKCLVSGIVSGNLAGKRIVRIEEALMRKCPKLNAAKFKSENSKSLLIFESDDLIFSNQQAIAEAVVFELLKRKNGDMPDDIYLVETDLVERWSVWIIKEGNKHFPDIDGWGPYYFNVLGDHTQLIETEGIANKRTNETIHKNAKAKA